MLSQLAYYSKVFGPQVLLQLNIAYYLPSIPILLAVGRLERVLDAELGPTASMALRLSAGLAGCCALAAAYPFTPMRLGSLLGVVVGLGSISAVAFSTSYQLVAWFRSADTIALGIGCVASGPLALVIQIALQIGTTPKRWQWIALFEAAAGIVLLGLAAAWSLFVQYWPVLSGRREWVDAASAPLLDSQEQDAEASRDEAAGQTALLLSRMLTLPDPFQGFPFATTPGVLLPHLRPALRRAASDDLSGVRRQSNRASLMNITVQPGAGGPAGGSGGSSSAALAGTPPPAGRGGGAAAALGDRGCATAPHARAAAGALLARGGSPPPRLPGGAAGSSGAGSGSYLSYSAGQQQQGGQGLAVNPAAAWLASIDAAAAAAQQQLGGASVGFAAGGGGAGMVHSVSAASLASLHGSGSRPTSPAPVPPLIGTLHDCLAVSGLRAGSAPATPSLLGGSSGGASDEGASPRTLGSPHGLPPAAALGSPRWRLAQLPGSPTKLQQQQHAAGAAAKPPLPAAAHQQQQQQQQPPELAQAPAPPPPREGHARTGSTASAASAAGSAAPSAFSAAAATAGGSAAGGGAGSDVESAKPPPGGGGEGQRHGPAAGPSYAAVFAYTWQVVVATLVASTLLNAVFPFFTYVESSGLLGEFLPQVLFYTRMLADIAGRLLPRRKALALSSPGALLGLAGLLLCGGAAFFAYLQVPPRLQSDPYALALVLLLWLLGGYINTLAYIIAPGLVPPAAVPAASALMAFTHQVAHILGLAAATGLALALYGDISGSL
ncbi:hypothetical protein HT031_004601 [Scenedesmus sp. PABB004]|nr:hypothetical protein HT031_004601 [Scenedesmus sp. PABB004]